MNLVPIFHRYDTDITLRLVPFEVMSEGGLWLLIVVVVAVGVAIIRGGRLTNLGEIELRLWPLLIVGFLVQAASSLVPSNRSWSSGVGITLLLLSFLFILLVIIANRSKPGMWLAGFGILMNFSVIAANGGMPVLEAAAVAAAGFDTQVTIDNFKHVHLGPDSRLMFLSDVIPVRFPWGSGTVLSLGDVFLAVGLGRFLESELRRPVRWFKHGVPSTTPTGSANRT